MRHQTPLTDQWFQPPSRPADHPVYRTGRCRRRLGYLALLTLFFVPGAKALELQLGAEIYRIELATTFEQRRQGLMHRRSLGQREGMLLVYPQAGDRRIWMKNMRIALRVYWIDENSTVIDVQRLEPCQESPCPVYAVDRPARYVLELADHEHPLAVGDRISGIPNE